MKKKDKFEGVYCIHGYPGGGLPSMDEMKVLPVKIAVLERLEAKFNETYCEHAGISPEDDPFTVSETVYDDAGGWVCLSPRPLIEAEVDEFVKAGILYFMVESLVQTNDGHAGHLYMGVGGV